MMTFKHSLLELAETLEIITIVKHTQVLVLVCRYLKDIQLEFTFDVKLWSIIG
jgi:hypothetical protein